MLEKGILSSGKGVQRAWGEQKGLKPEEHVWRWGEMGRQEAQGQVLRALESHNEESQSGQPSGTLLWRGASFLSWEAISPRRETWMSRLSPQGDSSRSGAYSEEPPDGSVRRLPSAFSCRC